MKNGIIIMLVAMLIGSVASCVKKETGSVKIEIQGISYLGQIERVTAWIGPGLLRFENREVVCYMPLLFGGPSCIWNVNLRPTSHPTKDTSDE